MLRDEVRWAVEGHAPIREAPFGKGRALHYSEAIVPRIAEKFRPQHIDRTALPFEHLREVLSREQERAGQTQFPVAGLSQLNDLFDAVLGVPLRDCAVADIQQRT